MIPPRLELKYQVTEAQAASLERAIEPFCEPDTHGAGEYLLTTLYFDTPSRTFLRARERRDADRLKLRARVYGEPSEAEGVRLEIKRKTGAFVRKERALVAREEWADVARGVHPPRLGPSTDVHERFAAVRLRTQAEPVVVVRYRRRAFVSRVDAYARVTFDRRLVAFRPSRDPFEPAPGSGIALDGARGAEPSPIILELKCERAMPAWMAAVVRFAHLERTGVSKYGVAMDALRRRDCRSPRWSVMYA